jgi:hypothetical protein
MTLTVPAFQKRLANAPSFVVPVFAAIVAFLTYSCMYAFRKPYTSATFDGITAFGINYKILLVIAQTIGYTLSKFLGIKVIAEMKQHRRAVAIIGLIGFAWLMLLFFGLAPRPYNIVFLFLNGIPLGLIWGLVYSYIEGRRATEFMGAVLAVSFIFSSGLVKSVGKWLVVDIHISEFWMPFFAGLIFIVPIIILVFLLEQIPPPTAMDIELRTKRLPMTAQQRKDFVMSFLPGILMLVVTYVMLSVMRDFRDNFGADIWKEAGFGKSPEIFTTTEIPTSILVLVMMSLVMLIKDNFKALVVNHAMVIIGFALALISTFLFSIHAIGAIPWMICNGLGLYMGYIPFNVMLFERMIASFKRPANVGFLIYISDSFAYLGSICILLYKNFGQHNLSWISFFSTMVYIVCSIGIVFTIFSQLYFNKKKHLTS